MPRPLLVLFLLFLALPAGARAVPVTFVVTPPPDTPSGATLHLAGNFQGWQPGSPAWRLAPRADGRHELTAEFSPMQSLQFKITLGSWPSVEKGPAGEEIANRRHVVGAGPDTLEITVAKWADGRPVRRPDTITGRVETIKVPGFLDGRRVWVYLPPGYDDEPGRRYPVLYMTDGQNVFNDATSFVGEWRVDETLERLIPAGRVAPLIVVAVDHGGDRRTVEYTPWPARNLWDAGGGKDHLQAWCDALKPAIDARYRTLSGPRDTGLAGSSLGGLMALYGGFARPDVFGRVAAFSPSLLFAGDRVRKLCDEAPARPTLVYVDMGTREGGDLRDENRDGRDDFVAALRELAEVLTARGYVGGWDLLVVEGEDHEHNEQAWATRFPTAVEFLFPPE